MALADLPGIVAERGYPSEAGQPHGRAIVHVLPESGMTRDAAVAALWDRRSRQSRSRPSGQTPLP